MKTAAALGLGLALALGAPSTAGAGEATRPGRAARPPEPPRVGEESIGDGPVAVAGAVGAGLQPDERMGDWRLALSSGLAFRFNGYPVDPDQRNAPVMLAFGGQADGTWTEGFGRAARLRVRLLTGGERVLFLPSDGEVEAAYALGRRELRFVVGRIEVSRSPGLAIQGLAQLATLPSFEGTVPLAGDQARLFYSLSPVEMAWVWYYDRAHIDHRAGWATETDHPDVATSVRARATFALPPAVLLSVEGDFLKLWGSVDQLLGLEASAGVAVLERTVLVSASMRWEQFTRRGTAPGTHASADQFVGQAAATLVF